LAAAVPQQNPGVSKDRGTAPGPVVGAQRRKKRDRKTWIRAKL